MGLRNRACAAADRPLTRFVLLLAPAAGWYDSLLPDTEILFHVEDSACSALPVCDDPLTTDVVESCVPPDHPLYIPPRSAGAPGALWNLQKRGEQRDEKENYCLH